MEKNRQTKIISIIALVVAVIGMSVGFAAFSNTLTISSSATVTPNSEDFKLVAYGLGEAIEGEIWYSNPINSSLYTSKTAALPVLGGDWNDTSTPISGETASITVNGDAISINNISTTFSKPNDNIIYPIMIKNEGAYDAYVTGFEEIGTKTCTAGTGTTQALMEAACKNISLSLAAMTLAGQQVDLATDDVKLAPGEYMVIGPEIHYFDSAVNTTRADGPFEIDFPDIKITYSSAA